MQTSLLSAQQEEKQPERSSAQDLSQSEGSSRFEITQPKLTPVNGGTNLQTPLMAEKKRSKVNIAAIGLAFLLFVLLLSFAWLGYWAYTLSTELVAAQGQLTTLQSEHAKLQTDYTTLMSENEKLNADLGQSKADLEKTNTELKSAQVDLSESKQKSEKLDGQIDAARTLAEILYTTATSDEESDILKIDRLINESNNQELLKQWDTFTRSPSEDAFSAFLDYLVLGIRNGLR